MYLKSISIKNYRKFGNEPQKIEFAHDCWGIDTSYDKTEEYISKSATLMVGRNNSGKTTILSLLKCLQNTKCHSTNIFKYTDFNLNYLRQWYDENIYNKNVDDIMNIPYEKLPILEFNLEIGIDDKEDVIGKFEDILIVRDVIKEELQDEDIANVNICIKYEVGNVIKFLTSLSSLNKKNIIKISRLELELDEVRSLFPKGETEVTIDELRDKIDLHIKIKKFIDFFDEEKYREFLQQVGGSYYTLNFYPLENDAPAENFSLSSLIKVKTIDANTVKDGKTLSNAYNKIVTTYIKNHEVDNLDNFMSQLNFTIRNTVEDEITPILQDAVTSIESAKNLKMNLKPDVDLQTIFNHGIIYEYQEGGNYIPESQFGLGYTNLMVIVSEIVDYIELYSTEDVNGAVNILCIEEPESFMHPQMQELFIKNISKAIAKLLGNKNEEKLDTFQIIITTHSSSILNSKIHSGNTLNNIVYLKCNENNEIITKNIEDSELKAKGNIKPEIFNYIKKYLRLEASDIFFADAVILVEGVSEETYIRNLIDNDHILNREHIKVYRIDGAYAQQFMTLLKSLDMKTIIFTDLDIKRTDKEKGLKFSSDDKKENIPSSLTNLSDRISSKKRLTTNSSILFFARKNSELSNKEDIDHYIINLIDDKESLCLKERRVTLFSQGKINGNYATSFEEAIVLTNSENNNDGFKNKESLIKLLKYVHPQTKYFKDINTASSLTKNSYMYQVKLSDEKSKFSTGLVFLDTTDEEFSIRTPEYIDMGLQELRDFFSEETDE